MNSNDGTSYNNNNNNDDDDDDDDYKRNQNVISYWDVPVIRLDDEDEESIGEALQQAVIYPGCFYVEGHGIPQHHLDVFLNTSKRFFETWSMEEKEQAGSRILQEHPGYQLNTTHPREIFDFIRQRPRKERSSLKYKEEDYGRYDEDVFVVHDDVDSSSSLVVSKLEYAWPLVRDICLDYFDDVSYVASQLGSLLVKYVLQVDDGKDEALPQMVHESLLDDPSECIRINRYGLHSRKDHNAHTDRNFMALILTDHHEGLQVHHPEEGWKNVPIRRGALFVNLGDMMERWTNGYVKATLHRVAMTSTDDGDRYSAAFFLSPQWDARITPLWHFQSRHEQETGQLQQYPSILVSEYMSQP